MQSKRTGPFLFPFSGNFHQHVELLGKEIGNDIHHFGKFCSFLYWEGADIRPQIRPSKITDNPENFQASD